MGTPIGLPERFAPVWNTCGAFMSGADVGLPGFIHICPRMFYCHRFYPVTFSAEWLTIGPVQKCRTKTYYPTEQRHCPTKTLG